MFFSTVDPPLKEKKMGITQGNKELLSIYDHVCFEQLGNLRQDDPWELIVKTDNYAMAFDSSSRRELFLAIGIVLPQFPPRSVAAITIHCGMQLGTDPQDFHDVCLAEVRAAISPAAE